MLGGLKQASVLAVASVALLQLMPAAQAGERMQLGVQMAPAVEFQTQVGDRVFFSEGSAELGTRARTALEAQAAWLKRHSAFSVTIEGHADDAGAAAHNQDVSWRRAEAVRRRLIESGVAAQRIFIVAYGRDRLIAECTAPGCSAQNRRVVTVLGEPDAASPDSAGASGPEQSDTAARRSPRRLY
jgi:outer membrane protein OmpA-like peptidoglycan-associated protein